MYHLNENTLSNFCWLCELSMFCVIIVFGIVLNPTLSARISSNAFPPEDPSTTYFSAVFYTRKSPTHETQYFLVHVRCGAALISTKWLITSKNCRIRLSWNILIGVRTIPRHGIYKQNKYKIKRTINSLEALLILVEMDRRIEIHTIKIPSIVPFTLENANCIVASWLQVTASKATKKLHCSFHPKNSSVCMDYVKDRNLKTAVSETDICLLQKNVQDPVQLCLNDIGGPLLCGGQLLGLVYFIPVINKTKSGDCFENKPDSFYPVTAIHPDIDWVLFFITDRKSSSSNLYLNVYLYFTVIKLIIS